MKLTKSSNNGILGTLVIATSLAVSYSSPAKTLKKGKTNFIIIFADDQGYNDLSCFGSEKIKTLT